MTDGQHGGPTRVSDLVQLRGHLTLEVGLDDGVLGGLDVAPGGRTPDPQTREPRIDRAIERAEGARRDRPGPGRGGRVRRTGRDQAEAEHQGDQPACQTTHHIPHRWRSSAQ